MRVSRLSAMTTAGSSAGWISSARSIAAIPTLFRDRDCGERVCGSLHHSFSASLHCSNGWTRQDRTVQAMLGCALPAMRGFDEDMPVLEVPWIAQRCLSLPDIRYAARVSCLAWRTIPCRRSASSTAFHTFTSALTLLYFVRMRLSSSSASASMVEDSSALTAISSTSR